MSRPMLLVRKEVLEELHSKRKLNVPLTSLIKQHRLDMTHPTLSKMLTYYDALVNVEDPTTAEVIKASLFPEWLKQSCGAVSSCPYEWYYSGVFPFGKWVRR